MLRARLANSSANDHASGAARFSSPHARLIPQTKKLLRLGQARPRETGYLHWTCTGVIIIASIHKQCYVRSDLTNKFIMLCLTGAADFLTVSADSRVVILQTTLC